MSLNNKVAIVTGASSGIGAAIAIKFAAEGAKVVIVGRNKEKLKNTTQKCEKAGGKVLVIAADVSKDDDAKRIVNETVKQLGKIDILINNAGFSKQTKILENDAVKKFDEIMATNLRAVVVLTNLAGPHLVATKGNIVNISSVAGIAPLSSNLFAYGTSKAGLDHFTRCVALDLASKGVRVNVVNPGPVRTDIGDHMGFDAAKADAFWEYLKKSTALNRVSEPEETADVVLFLASDKAKGITGSSYVTDNGTLLKGSMAPLQE